MGWTSFQREWSLLKIPLILDRGANQRGRSSFASTWSFEQSVYALQKNSFFSSSEVSGWSVLFTPTIVFSILYVVEMVHATAFALTPFYAFFSRNSGPDTPEGRGRHKICHHNLDIYTSRQPCHLLSSSSWKYSLFLQFSPNSLSWYKLVVTGLRTRLLRLTERRIGVHMVQLLPRPANAFALLTWVTCVPIQTRRRPSVRMGLVLVSSTGLAWRARVRWTKGGWRERKLLEWTKGSSSKTKDTGQCRWNVYENFPFFPQDSDYALKQKQPKSPVFTCFHVLC